MCLLCANIISFMNAQPLTIRYINRSHLVFISSSLPDRSLSSTLRSCLFMSDILRRVCFVHFLLDLVVSNLVSFVCVE